MPRRDSAKMCKCSSERHVMVWGFGMGALRDMAVEGAHG